MGNNLQICCGTDQPEPAATLEAKLQTDFTSTQMSKCLALDWHRAGHSARMPQRLGDGFCSQGAASVSEGAPECEAAHRAAHTGHCDDKS